MLTGAEDDSRVSSSRRKLIALPPAIVALLVAAASTSALLFVQWGQFAGSFEAFCVDHVGILSDAKCGRGLHKMRFYVLALGVLPLFWLLELWMPANREEAIFSPSLLVDSVWLLALPVVTVGVLEPFSSVLDAVFGPLVHDLRLDFVASLPFAVKLVVVILLGDFLAWFSHYIRHKIPVLWEFHKIHHSQVQLNYFTSVRLHPGDLVANILIRFLPFTLLGLETGLAAFLIWSSFVRIYEMFVHSNLRMNLGPLRYILVTPQSHRIHHSIEERHLDRNFGDFFSIWDILFRTHCFESNVYPRVGLEGSDCPAGAATTIRGALRTFFSELTYPFRALGRGFRNR